MSATPRQDLVTLDKQYVWHPYTQMSSYARTNPFVIQRAEGPYLFDADGRRYIDANSSWWVSALGHNHPRLVRALVEQASSLCHVSLAGVTHEPAARLAERLVARAPEGLTRVFYSDDGSTALEAAIKMALGYHERAGRPRRSFVSLAGAFHGETLGVTALGGVELFRRRFADVLMNVHFVEPPSRSDDRGCAAEKQIVQLFTDRGEDLAALVVEPLVQGATGMRFYPAWYLRLARELCDRHGVLLVIDEVFTGYGRTGTFWACDAAPAQPDILCTAKAFSGGMLPMAATVVRERVFEAFLGEASRAFYYGHSFCGNPLGARIALEVLQVMEDEKIVEGIAVRSERIRARFESMGSIPGVKDTRAMGMIGALDLADASYLGETGWRVHAAARERNVYLRPLGDVVYIAPPLNIPLDALDELLDVVDASVRISL